MSTGKGSFDNIKGINELLDITRDFNWFKTQSIIEVLQNV